MNKVQIIEEINKGNISLRKISLKDAGFLYVSLNKEVTKYLSIPPLSSLEYSKRLIKGYLNYWDQNTQYHYIIEMQDYKSEDNNIKKVGCVSIWGISWLHKRAEIGIWLNSKYRNRGIGKASLSLIKNIAFNHLNLNRLEAHIAIENIPSITLFKKCDFIQEGVLKQYLNLKGVYHDAAILAYLNKFLKF